MPIIFSEPVYTLDEAAKVLNLTLRTIRNHVASKLIKTENLSQIKGARVITETELRRFERERRPVGNPNLVARRASDMKRGM